MYKAPGRGNTFKRMVDISDYYLCEVYDRLWGDRIYRIARKAHHEQRHLYWYESFAHTLADFLPPSIIGTWYYISKYLLRSTLKKIKILEKIMFTTEGQ